MPPRRDVLRAAGVPRRAVLAAGGRALVLVAAGTLPSGCGFDVGDVRLDRDVPVPAPEPGPDEPARQRAAADAERLQAAATAAAAAGAGPADLLETIAGDHEQHVRALSAAGGGSTPAPTGTPAGTQPGTAAAPGTGPGGDDGQPGAERLPGLENAAAVAALSDVPRTGGPLARLLACVAASRAAHTAVLAGALDTPVPPPPALVVPDDVGRLATPGSDAAAALRRCLDGEHAAVYAYGVVGARVGPDLDPLVARTLAGHEQSADALALLLDRAGLPVPPAAPAYRLPGPLDTPQQALALAVGVEEGLAAAYAALVAHAGAGPRAHAANRLLVTTVLLLDLGATPPALPGMPEQADAPEAAVTPS